MHTSGKATLNDSEIPFKLSQQANKISWTPRDLSSLNIFNHCLADSLSAIQNPNISLNPSILIPIIIYTNFSTYNDSSLTLNLIPSTYTIG